MKLTERQQQILDYLRAEHRRTGIIPSTREIQDAFGFASQTAAVSHLRALEKKGAILKDDRKARSIRFADDPDREPVVDIPVYGAIPAGYGDDTAPVAEGMLTVDTRSVGVKQNAKIYALRVRGESMIGAHILDGDHVLIEDREAKNRDVVAALIDGETTLKRFIVEGTRRFLKAENPDYPDLHPVHELTIQGVMVGLIRGQVARW